MEKRALCGGYETLLCIITVFCSTLTLHASPFGSLRWGKPPAYFTYEVVNMNDEKQHPVEANADELRREISEMVDTMTDAQLDQALILLRQWLLEGSP
ncbi:MAG: hypothetical protein LBI19_07340 [Oscillospiraceae bacterium]|nr:hypothetical protein [Oscillospiraceae bacterium]